MKLKKLFLISLVPLAISAIIYYQSSQITPMCPHHENACYFTEGYYQSRSLFREKAQRLGLPLYEKHIKNNKTSDLTIDFTIINEPQTKEQQQQPTLIHQSGTHGAEGYAGSAIQVAFLDKILKKEIEVPKNITIVLVHAANPFGFLFNRRWNENGVDLNRNVLPDNIYPGELKKLNEMGSMGGYQTYHHILNQDIKWQSPWDDIKLFFNVAYLIITKGFFEIKQALVNGQYYCDNCLWYGGKEVQPSVNYVREFLKEKIQNTEKAIFIDVHTGLGPESLDTLIATESNSKGIKDIFINNNITSDQLGKDYFISDGQKDNIPFGLKKHKGEANATVTDVGKGYEYLKGSMKNMMQTVRVKRALSLTQEFGTLPGILVVKALIQENSYWRRSDTTPDEFAIGASQTKSAFHRENLNFKNNVIRRGLALIKQSLIALNNDKLSENIPELY